MGNTMLVYHRISLKKKIVLFAKEYSVAQYSFIVVM